jgi:polyhydroxyalkanoate synthesis regulator phasin
MRRTVHIVPTEHIAEYYQATKRVGGRRTFQLTPVHKKIVKTLDEKGHLTAQELAEYIGELKKKVQTPYGDMSIGQLRLRELTQSTTLVPVKPRGDWKSNLHTYTSFKTWLPAVDLQVVNEQEAKKRIIYRYLSSFGPVAIEDIAWWIGIAKSEVKEILEGLGDDVARIAIRGLEGEYFVSASDVEQLEKCPSGKDTAHLLPKFDPYIMGYKNRQRLISPKYEKKVYWSTRAEVSPTIVFNGRVIGTWSHSEENSKVSIALAPFEKANKHVMSAIEQQAEKLASFIGGQDAE